MGECLAERLAPVDFLVPVPLHPARLRERGYNQSLEIALGLGEVLGMPVLEGVLRRCKNTAQQAQLAASQRQRNVESAFSLEEPLPPGRCIALVDDVLTTGATIGACARTFGEGASVDIWAVVLARAEHHGYSMERSP